MQKVLNNEVVKKSNLRTRIFHFIDRIVDKIINANHDVHARWLFISFILFLFVPILLTKVLIPWEWLANFFDFSTTGQIGDTIGGITAPFIGLIAAILTFLAFHEQYKANKNIEMDMKRDRFENKFYHLLELLNSLETNTSIKNVGNSKKAFHFMFYEYKAMAVLIYKKQKDAKFSKEIDINKEAFTYFLDGVSSTTTSRISEKSLYSQDLNSFFLYYQSFYNSTQNPKVPYLDDYTTTKIKLFDGHRFILIPFFRLSCKALEMIFNYGKDEEAYISLLFSTMSEHQIALLKLMFYYNEDESKLFITKNRVKIKNFLNPENNKDEIKDSTIIVSIDNYISSDTMNCTKKSFIDYERGTKVK